MSDDVVDQTMWSVFFGFMSGQKCVSIKIFDHHFTISSGEYNERQPDVILMPVTSQLRAGARPLDVIIESWKFAGLLKPSAVKPVIATLEQALVIGRLGAIEPTDRKSLTLLLKKMLSE